MVLVPLVFGGITGGIFFVVIFMTMILGTIGTMGFSGGGIYAGSISMLIVLFIIWGIIIVAAIAYTAFMSVLRGLVNYQIYRRFHTESKAVLHMLLSIFVPLYQGIFFFMLRKRVQVEPKERKSE